MELEGKNKKAMPRAKRLLTVFHLICIMFLQARFSCVCTNEETELGGGQQFIQGHTADEEHQWDSKLLV